MNETEARYIARSMGVENHHVIAPCLKDENWLKNQDTLDFLMTVLLVAIPSITGRLAAIEGKTRGIPTPKEVSPYDCSKRP